MTDPEKNGSSVAFSSILFDESEAGTNTDDREAPECLADLNLVQIVDAITAGRDEYNLKPFFYTPLTHVEAIACRYDMMDHRALGQSPREALEQSIAQTGSRFHRRIAYDRDFLIFTLLTTRKGTAKITGRCGMKVNHLYYWSEYFRNPTWQSKQVPVRYDPFDIGRAFAFVDRQWIECHFEHYASLHGHSEREVHLASEELRRRRQNHSGQEVR